MHTTWCKQLGALLRNERPWRVGAERGAAQAEATKCARWRGAQTLFVIVGDSYLVLVDFSVYNDLLYTQLRTCLKLDLII